MKKSVTNSATVFAVALALAGCATGSGAADTSRPSGATDYPNPLATAPPLDEVIHNAVDSTFVQGMIAHHRQAVEMSEIILRKQDVDPRVTALADEIKAAQAQEISTMTRWLTTWNEPEQMASGHATGGHSMTGMMSQEDLDELKAAPGTEAAKLFLGQMITHQQGAVTMAKTAVANGENVHVIALSKDIISFQEAEIQEMQTLLGTL